MYLIGEYSDIRFLVFSCLPPLIWLWRAPTMLDAECGFSILMLWLHKFWWTPKFFGFLQMENWISDFVTPPIMQVRWISWLWFLCIKRCVASSQCAILLTCWHGNWIRFQTMRQFRMLSITHTFAPSKSRSQFSHFLSRFTSLRRMGYL